MNVYDNCVNNGRTYEYSINEDMIVCSSDMHEFQIMNYSSFEGDTLKLKLIEPSNYSYPIGGIYTIVKQ